MQGGSVTDNFHKIEATFFTNFMSYANSQEVRTQRSGARDMYYMLSLEFC